MDNQSLRLNKFLAERLGVSRREADDLIAAGTVLVNGKPAALGVRIDKNDKVCYNKKIIPFETDYLYLAMNKPVGYVCSRRAQGSAPTLYDLLPEEYKKLKTVGRLDKDSSGLILLTNDGDFAFQMTHPKFHKEKVYEVELDRSLEPLHQQMISDYGIMLDDGPSKFLIIKKTAGHLSRAASARPVCLRQFASQGASATGERRSCSPCQAPQALQETPLQSYQVILSEGRNRQIRRTFAALGYKVVKLHRTEFGIFKLNNLPSGKFQVINGFDPHF